MADLPGVCHTAIELAGTLAQKIYWAQTLDQVTVYLEGNPDIVLDLALRIQAMGYKVAYKWWDDDDDNVCMYDQMFDSSLYVATDAVQFDTLGSVCFEQNLSNNIPFVVLDDQPGKHKLGINAFLLVLSTAATCRRAWTC